MAAEVLSATSSQVVAASLRLHWILVLEVVQGTTYEERVNGKRKKAEVAMIS